MLHRVALFLVALSCALSLAERGRAAVVISEIMYNPVPGRDYEFVELHNDGSSDVDLGGWSLEGGVRFTFPDGAAIPAGGRLVICRSVETIRGGYPGLDAAIVLGDWEGSLANEGERITLRNATGVDVDTVAYDDELPWDFLADGLGASLERLCNSAAGDLPENWRASSVPAERQAPGGTPGETSLEPICPPQPVSRPPVFVSEIMYHPVLERSLEEEHEFVEIHNAGASELSLAGWSIAGGVDFVFPEGASIAAGGYRVVAKSRERLAEVYDLPVESIFGDYERELDNGGEKVVLIGADGQGVDQVTYDDDFPWPIAADGLGAGEEWLRRDLLPLADHAHKGHSLERISFDIPGADVVNWAPSPLDGATPGAANASAADTPPTIVTWISVFPERTEEDLVREDDTVRIQVQLRPTRPSGAVELDFFIEDVERDDETIETIALTDDGRGGDVIAGDSVYAALLPAQADNTIVRYRVRADVDGSGSKVLSPRPTDPNEWHAYFVSPVIDTETRVYQVFISRRNWGTMWNNIQGGRVRGCAPSPTWNARVPAILVHEGRVFDIFTRYQGSRWNRTNGPAISRWPFPGPTSGGVRALSWRLALPRYNQLEGRSVIVLNKLTQGCPGYNAGVGYRLFERAGIPASRTRFARLHVNGGYYHYMIELERPGEDMMRRVHAEEAARNPDSPRERVGHLYKSAGCTCDEGPWGWGDQRLLNDFCGHPKELRYAFTYDRKTHGWDTHDEFIALIEELHRARSGGVPAIRAYFEEHFDIELLMNYLAIINYQVPFDDMFQNHFMYQRLSDGKWLLMPWDLDRNFGEWKGAVASIYVGEQGDPDNRSGWWNRLKDAFFKGFRDEFADHMLLMNNTILHPDRIRQLVEEVRSEANQAEARQAPAGISCGATAFDSRASTFMSFALVRHRHINNLAGIFVDAGEDVTVFQGGEVRLDASGSRPDPGPDVSYSWHIAGLDRMLEGEVATTVVDEPGEYEVTLTLTTRGVPFQDTILLTVKPTPEFAFRERGGFVAFEAESFADNLRSDDESSRWEPSTDKPGFSGASAMLAGGSGRYLTSFAGRAPELQYPILFETPGVYRVWVRGLCDATASDTMHLSIDGVPRGSTAAHEFQVDPTQYLWSGLTRRDEVQEVEVKTAGLHFLSMWIREPGLLIDKFVLTMEADFVPDDLGPAESARVRFGGAEPFVRGDVDATSDVEITDAIRILTHLFQFAGVVLVECEDHGDADDNGQLQITDAIYLLRYLFQSGPEPRPPFPMAGLDETGDAFDCGGP